MKEFFVDIGDPRVHGDLVERDLYDFNDVFARLFKKCEDKCRVIVNGNSIDLIYRYDIADHFIYLVSMLSFLLESDEGEEIFNFASNDLYLDFDMKWANGRIRLDVYETMRYDYIDFGSLNIGLNYFLKSWLPLLELTSRIVHEYKLNLELIEEYDLLESIKTKVSSLYIE
ncbi:MAG: hypothetical protein OEZ68_17465 [Gammaproteobacteria bacterium]|nr:hypothetical protein [Gammaproteobacteria bacterium]MDH5802593.1 hypothetical protein [Gammaproteobacteria bacterium]